MNKMVPEIVLGAGNALKRSLEESGIEKYKAMKFARSELMMAIEAIDAEFERLERLLAPKY